MRKHPLVSPGIIVSGMFASASIWVPLLLANFQFLQLHPTVLMILGICLHIAASISSAISIYQTSTIFGIDKPTVYAATTAILPQIMLVKTLSTLMQRILANLKASESVQEDPDVKEKIETLSRLTDPLDLALALVTFGLHTAYYTVKSYFLLKSLAYIEDNLATSVK